MKRSSTYLLVLAAAAGLTFTVGYAQAPLPGATSALVAQGGFGGGRGRGGIPDVTPEQTQALTDMTAALAPLTTAATDARNELAMAAITSAGNAGAVNAAVDKVRAAELAVATARAAAFAELQASPNRLNPEQVAALISAGGNVGGRGGFRGGGGARGGARGGN